MTRPFLTQYKRRAPRAFVLRGVAPRLSCRELCRKETVGLAQPWRGLGQQPSGGLRDTQHKRSLVRFIGCCTKYSCSTLTAVDHSAFTDLAGARGTRTPGSPGRDQIRRLSYCKS